MERKDFLTKMLFGGSILMVAPMIISACSKADDNNPTNTNPGNNGNNPITVDLTNSAYSALGAVGGYAYKDDILVIRSSENSYVALSKICTHQSCTVAFASGVNEVQCPCHGSKFRPDGSVINGPASSPLRKFNVTKDGNILTIS